VFPLKFLEIKPELASNYSKVIAPQDVAVYGALCALASFDRSEMKVNPLVSAFVFNLAPFVLVRSKHDLYIFTEVIDNMNFQQFLELVPEVRELVNDFNSWYEFIEQIRLLLCGCTSTARITYL
jgi:COP9 signalosome complex subunit 1